MKRNALARYSSLTLAAIFLSAAPALAYVVVLKDGSKIFARAKYEVKGSNAIITLENGNITQVLLSQIDTAGTDKYNKENIGNVIAISTPKEQELQKPKTSQEPGEKLNAFIKERQHQKESQAADAARSLPADHESANAPDPIVAREAARILSDAGVTQYRALPGPKVVIVTNDEDSVFRALNASAKLAVDLAGVGRGNTLEVNLVTSGGEDAGKFKLTADDARSLMDGSVTASEFFVKHVIF